MAGSAPTVLKIRRVTELKNVCASSGVGAAGEALEVAGLHRRPEGALQDRVLQDVAHVGDRAVEVDAVEREPRGRVGLGAAPVAPLEPVARAAGDLLESADPVLVGGVDRRGGRAIRLAWRRRPTRSD